MIDIGRPDAEKSAKQWGAKYMGAWEMLLPVVDGRCTATEHEHALLLTSSIHSTIQLFM